MKFAPIVPIPILPRLKDRDYHMVLAPLVESLGEYAKFYARVEGFKILDNGAAEDKPISPQNLITYALAIGADEVVAPDVMYETDASIALAQTFVPYAANVHVKSMVVLQATNWDDFWRMVGSTLELPIAALALPKLLTGTLGDQARLIAAEQLRKLTNLPIHCLGCGAYTQEIRALAGQGIVRGIDSAAPVVMGLQGRSIDGVCYEWETSHKAIDNYWEQESNDLVEENLNLFDAWCSNVDYIGGDHYDRT